MTSPQPLDYRSPSHESRRRIGAFGYYYGAAAGGCLIAAMGFFVFESMKPPQAPPEIDGCFSVIIVIVFATIVSLIPAALFRLVSGPAPDGLYSVASTLGGINGTIGFGLYFFFCALNDRGALPSFLSLEWWIGLTIIANGAIPLWMGWIARIRFRGVEIPLADRAANPPPGT